MSGEVVPSRRELRMSDADREPFVANLPAVDSVNPVAAGDVVESGGA
ncbi:MULTISPECIES: hypothetical protein [unclassified Micromonospora]